MHETILVTGGAGYIGTHLVKELLMKDYKVVVLDNLQNGFLEPLEYLKKYGELNFEKANLVNKPEIDAIFKKYPAISKVVHLAALLSVHESVLDPDATLRTNIGGSINLLDSMKEHNVNEIVFSSSCTVYGDSKNDDYFVYESDEVEPTSPYGHSKTSFENVLLWFSKLHNFRAISLRLFNVTGCSPEFDIGDSKEPSPHLVQNAVRGALGIAPFELTYAPVDTPDGSPIRGYVDVNDVVSAIILSLENLDNITEFKIYNVASGYGLSVLEAIEDVERVLTVNLGRTRGEARRGENTAVVGDISKIKSDLGWEPKFSLRESIYNLKRWYEIRPGGFSH